MGLFENWRRRRAIRASVKRLPRQLAQDYGRREEYTPKQVVASMDRLRMSQHSAGCAIALFSSREAFEAWAVATGKAGAAAAASTYDLVRQEAADFLFEGDPDFDADDVAGASVHVFGGGDGFGGCGDDFGGGWDDGGGGGDGDGD